MIIIATCLAVYQKLFRRILLTRESKLTYVGAYDHFILLYTVCKKSSAEKHYTFSGSKGCLQKCSV